jgi:NADH-quinone oxidoreductase subunit K
MSPQEIILVISGTLAIGGALALVIWRGEAFLSVLLLALSCLGVAGLFVSLEAYVPAAFLLLVYGGGVAFLARFAPQPFTEMMRRCSLGPNRRWWVAALVALVLCEILAWGILRRSQDLLSWYLILAAALFCVGLYAVLGQRNAVAALMGIGVMLNAVAVNLAAFGRYGEAGTAAGQAFALAVTAVAATEAVVGLALIALLWRTRGTVVLDDVDALKES